METALNVLRDTARNTVYFFATNRVLSRDEKVRAYQEYVSSHGVPPKKSRITVYSSKDFKEFSQV